MLLIHLIETPVDIIPQASKSLLQHISQANDSAQEAKKWRDSTRIMSYMMPLYKWVRDNYRSNQNYNLKHNLQRLLTNRSVKDTIQALLATPELPKDSENYVSAEKILWMMVRVLAEVNDKVYNNQSLSKQLNHAWDSLYKANKYLRHIPNRAVGISSEKAKQQTNTTSTHATHAMHAKQVDELISATLKSIDDKALAAQIRREISKSDNKLKALQQAMIDHKLI